MREILMPYGRGTIRFEVDEARLAGVLEAEHPSAGTPEAEIVLCALENPIGSVRLCELTKGKRSRSPRIARLGGDLCLK